MFPHLWHRFPRFAADAGGSLPKQSLFPSETGLLFRKNPFFAKLPIRMSLTFRGAHGVCHKDDSNHGENKNEFLV